MNFDLNTHYMIEKLENELKIYKNIERELGIDLITLFKALKNGIYGTIYGGEKNKGGGPIVFFDAKAFNLCLHERTPFLYCPEPIGNFYRLTDYGKTWALTKEELE